MFSLGITGLNEEKSLKMLANMHMRVLINPTKVAGANKKEGQRREEVH